jgi:ectoine hydroxylase-related dioxygenase (phytanoyl-CoA dioxygenase family)
MKDFERDGFAIVPSVANDEEIAALIGGIEGAGANGFSYKRGRDRYAIRNLLEIVPAVKAFANLASVRILVKSILGAEAFAVRGLLFDKTPSANWKVAWHQDLTIAVRQRSEVAGYGPWSIKAGVQHVQPPTSVLEGMLTMRLHLDNCSDSNGPLRVLPGSHRAGKLSATDIKAWCKRVPAVNCIAKCGSALLMRPLLLHASSTAQEPGHRRVIHLEFAARPLDGNLQWNV